MITHNMFLLKVEQNYISRVMRKPAFCLCKNKCVDHQSLCFRYIDSTSDSVAVKSSLCGA